MRKGIDFFILRANRETGRVAEFNSVMNKLMVMTNYNVDGMRVHNETWAQQLKDAMNVNGGDIENATAGDYVMHFLTFGFKVRAPKSRGRPISRFADFTFLSSDYLRANSPRRHGRRLALLLRLLGHDRPPDLHRR